MEKEEKRGEKCTALHGEKEDEEDKWRDSTLNREKKKEEDKEGAPPCT